MSMHRRRKRRRVDDFLKRITVVSDEEAEQADMVICCRVGMPTYFTDDVYSVCADCGIAIFHRPHVPKKPKKVCIECALKSARAADEKAAQEKAAQEQAGDDTSADETPS